MTSAQAAPLPPLPDVGDPLMAPFWEGTRAGQLRLPFCIACGAAQWPPRPTCHACNHVEGFEWRGVEAAGVVYSFFVSYRAFHPAFAAQLPYAVAAVELAPGIRVLGRVVMLQATKVRIGLPMRAAFVPITDEVTLLQWVPA